DMAGRIKTIVDQFVICFFYKSSYDKANRTSLSATRGIGIEKAIAIFSDLKKELGCSVLTDVHTEEQCMAVASVVDVLQIPAFL
ncbi:MAG: 3-deoxy-8-phosphooctulonate synthase, partial [Bartonella sp.]|nr:3-deoxy-8-phosphooctulonate synthase [Bartonella sp.]